MLYEHTGHDFGSDVTRILAEKEAAKAAKAAKASGKTVAQQPAVAPVSALQDVVVAEETSSDRVQSFDTNPLKVVAESPVSTFSIDSDTASYAYVRRALKEGQLPQPKQTD